MDILMSETCWAHKKWNKIASDIKLVFYSLTITKPINSEVQIHNFKTQTSQYNFFDICNIHLNSPVPKFWNYGIYNDSDSAGHEVF